MEVVTSLQVPHLARARAKAWVVGAVIGLQLAVPAVLMLTQDAPARFAFPMYSGQGHVDVLIQDADGQELPFDSLTLAGFRPEIDWFEHLPAHLCRVVPAAHQVTVAQKGHESRLTCD